MKRLIESIIADFKAKRERKAHVEAQMALARMYEGINADEVRDSNEMAELMAYIHTKLLDLSAMDIERVRRYNVLAYKLYPHWQDRPPEE